MKVMCTVALLVAGLVLLPGPGVEASHSTFAPGDLFISLVSGQVEWRHPDGTLNRVLTSAMPGRAGGMAFDAAGNLYVTHFCEGTPYLYACVSGNGVEVFDPSGIPRGSFGSGYWCNPYSIRFDGVGNAYVGQLDCTGDILKFDWVGRPLAAYDVATEPDADWPGSPWIDLAADGCTALYTSGGRNVKRFDMCAGVQLADFNAAPLPDPTAKALRILPDSGVLLTNVSVIVRLNAAGEIVQTYDVPGEPDAWGWLDLVGDGTFWVSNHGSSNVYRLDIATGQVLAGFNAGSPPFTIIGVAVKTGPPAELTLSALPSPGTFAPGDLFVSLISGQVQWRHPDGTLNEVLIGAMPGRAGGMAFDAAGNLYVTHFCEGTPYLYACVSGNGVEVFDPSGIPRGSFGSGYWCNPYSIRFDGVGNAYVGQLDCTGDILKFDWVGRPLAAYDVATEPDADWQGSAWIDLAADGCTAFYTSGGRNVKRFDVCAGVQLADFNTAPLPDPTAKVLRILPDGGVLLTNVSVIVRLNAAGEIVQTYNVPGEPGEWGWLDLVGDGTFWVSNHGSSNVYRLDIATGQVLAGFNAGSPPFTIIGVAVRR